MALRVARGLFRLWLILSVLWVAGVAFMAWEKFADIDRLETQAIGKSDTSIPRPRGPWDDYADPMAPPVVSKTAAEERRTAIWGDGIRIAFLPPVFVLALGAALVWAFRGFGESDVGRKGKRS